MLSQIEKQIFKSWIGYAVEPRIAKFTGRQIRTTGPRIAVVGNCQAFGVAYSMKLMDPSATVHHYSTIGQSRFADLDLLVRTLQTYDYVFSHDFLSGHLRGPGDSAELRSRLPKVTRLPAITFAAFHPDLIYISDPAQPLHGFIFGPLGPYHSAIAVFAFRAGLTLDETRAMFNENVFTTLGYLNMWDEAASGFLATVQKDCGVDLSTDLMKWARKGVFMYSLVHPMGFVLFDVARRMWEKVGLTPPATDFSYYQIHDLARAEIFPVYPPIAKHFGVQGGYLFKLQNHHLANDVGDFLTLPQYLAACFKTYEKEGAARLGNKRVDGWLADEETKNLLISLARENLRKGLTPVS
ncbi:MAG: WcbI family polysaccharide biosynthesis putative acetyltransferase [Methylocystis sp.]|uniref:WcbI family polysaccharide biosynthesis putative acetyltransferase n=1 Tax=Methylocystis sp. TaxID=1911079 RepID=UPI003DA496B1